jgi:cytochrome c
MRETLALAAALAVGLSLANAADAPRFGQPIAPGDLAPWDISIAPDGVGLPPGSGTPTQGATVYAERGCALCHGEKGAGGPSGPLVGGGPLDRTDRDPVKLIGNYWPYARSSTSPVARCHRHRRTLTDSRSCADRLYPRTQQDHRRERRDERGHVAQSEVPNRDGSSASIRRALTRMATAPTQSV